jgi:hydroxyacylglutathione hydrolase
MILNTHWHSDHTQGNAEVKAATGAEIVGPEEVRRAAPLDRVIEPGDHVTLGDTRLEVIETGGHTLGHVSFYAPGHAFTGDALFSMGCGRMFEGTPEQMWAGLERLMALPDDTVVWSAHEYTAANARFALSVDGAPAVARRAADVVAARETGQPTVPSTIGLEKATNPMLRAPRLHPELAPAQAVARLRQGKDAFKG